MSNPYETPSAMASENGPSKSPPKEPKGLTQWLTIAIGFALGGLTAGLVQIPLIIACLLTPIANWVRLNGEFDGLLLFAFPVITIPSGVIAGAIIGIAWRSRYQKIIAMIAAALPALFYFLTTSLQDSVSKRQPDLFIAGCALSICMWLATAAAVWYVAWTFRRIERGKGLAVI